MNSPHSDNNLKILITHDDKGEANRLISLFRNANYRPDAKHTDQEDVLVKLLQERAWDLVLSQNNSQVLPPKTVIGTIRRENLDLPVILVDSEESPSSVVEGLKLGAADVVVMDHDQHMLQVVSRTLYNLDTRRKLRKWQRKYYDSEKRAERLLHNSKDGIAIVQEGTYLYVNDSFAKALDYADGDSMVCLPVIDTVADGFQESLKPYLRHISDEDSLENREIDFVGLTSEGIEVQVKTIVSQVEHEGEPALEFLMPRQYLSADLSAAVEQANPGAIQLDRMFESINGAIRKAAQSVSKAVLIYIEIDHFSESQKKLGIEKMEKLIAELSTVMNKEVGARHSLHRYKENNFVLLMQNTTADAGLRFAKNLADNMARDQLMVDQQPQSISLSIGVSVINEIVPTVDEALDRSIQAMLKARQESGTTNTAALYEFDSRDSSPDIDEIEEITQEFLQKGLFQLSYQPIIALHGKRQKIYEVLLQVAPEGSPDNLPSDYIAQVFNTKTALEVDRWVILESVKVLAKKQQQEPDTKLFINISSATLCDTEFLPWLKVALKASGVSTTSIVFQLREIDIARYSDQSRKFLELLKKIKSEAALSRFGLAIEPIKMLEGLTFDYIKIDPQLVKKLQEDDVNNDFGNLISRLREEPEQQVIVPFVESAKMIPELWQYGVHFIQGHFLQPPAKLMNFDFDAE